MGVETLIVIVTAAVVGATGLLYEKSYLVPHLWKYTSGSKTMAFITAIVALGMVFAMAAVGYGSEGQPEEPSSPFSSQTEEDS